MFFIAVFFVIALSFHYQVILFICDLVAEDKENLQCNATSHATATVFSAVAKDGSCSQTNIWFLPIFQLPMHGLKFHH